MSKLIIVAIATSLSGCTTSQASIFTATMLFTQAGQLARIAF